MTKPGFHNLTFSLTDEDHSKLRELAAVDERTQSYVIRKLIEAAHKELKT